MSASRWTAISYTAPDGTQYKWQLDEHGKLIPKSGRMTAMDYQHQTIRGNDNKEYSMKPPFDDMPPLIPKEPKK
jgi:YD repeat-containing protein